MYNMVRLSKITEDSKLNKIIQQNLSYFSGRIKRTLEAHTFFLNILHALCFRKVKKLL